MLESSGQNTIRLAEPLINISKASTPLRTRVLNINQHQPKTPISVRKIGGYEIVSPNKENNLVNHIRLESSVKKLTTKDKPFIENVNLSPILNLNKKLNQGPQKQGTQLNQGTNLNQGTQKLNQGVNKHSRTYTPNTLKNYESERGLSWYGNGNYGDGSYGDENYDAKQSGSPYRVADLKSSSSFKSLLQSDRNRNPSRLGSMTFNNLIKNSTTSSESSLENSLRSSKGLSTGFNFKSKKALVENSNQTVTQELMCANRHAAKAKYKVVDPEDSLADPLVYCSKCAIELVKKNFLVEDLSEDEARRILKGNQGTINEQPTSSRRLKIKNEDKHQQFASKLASVLDDLETSQLQFTQRFSKEIHKIEEYYDFLISMISDQKEKDRQLCMHFQHEMAHEAEQYQVQVKDALNLLKGCNNKELDLKAIDKLIKSKVAYPMQAAFVKVNGALKDYRENFMEFFEEEGKLSYLNVTKSVRQSAPHQNQTQFSEKSVVRTPNVVSCNSISPKVVSCSNLAMVGGRNNALRFSFQKALNEQTQRKKIMDMKPLVQDPDEQNMQEEADKAGPKAFRSLFPEEEYQLELDLAVEEAVHSPTFKRI